MRRSIQLAICIALITFSTTSVAEETLPSFGSSARITKVVGYDHGEVGASAKSTSSLDVVQHSCPTQEDSLEPFHDTVVGITVENSSSQLIRLNSFRYKVLGRKKKRFRSRKIALSGIGEIAPFESEEVYALFLDTVGAAKHFIGSAQSVSERDNIGIVNIRFLLFGEDASGRAVRLRAKSSFSFDDVERCE